MKDFHAIQGLLISGNVFFLAASASYHLNFCEAYSIVFTDLFVALFLHVCIWEISQTLDEIALTFKASNYIEIILKVAGFVLTNNFLCGLKICMRNVSLVN
jgi:hypothetical protein